MLKKKYTEMTAAELREATRQYDVEMIEAPGKPMSRSDKAKWERAKRRGRARSTENFERISVSIERELLKRTDALVHHSHLSRSELISVALGEVLDSPKRLEALKRDNPKWRRRLAS